MDEVSVLPAKMLLGIGRQGGLDLDALTAGLAFDARSLRRRRTGRVPWDDYCTLMERMEIAAGGPEPFEALHLRSYQATGPLEVRRVLGAMVSARSLYHFVLKTLDPALFPNVDMGWKEISGDRVRVTARLHPGSRPCRTFFRASFANLPSLTCHLGLPPARVEIVEATGHSAVCVIHLAPSQTLLARARRASAPALRDGVVWLVDFLAGEARAESDRLSALLARRPSRAEPDLVERVVAFESARGLTPKQSEVLALVVRGLSNKEIANELDCAENTVEFHVTQLLRKAGADSRAQLIARFWAEPLA